MSTQSNESNTDYLASIDRAVADSSRLQEWLVQRASLDSKVPTWQTSLLLESLQKQVGSQKWVSDPKLAQFLPIVLRAATCQDDLTSLEPWYRLILKRSVGFLDILRRYYYPLLIAASALLVFYYISLTIIPAFQSMFDDFQLRLPAPTKLVLAISNFVINHTLLALLQIFLGVAFLVGLFKLIGYLMDQFEGWKIVGFWRRGTKKSLGSMARWSGTLSELLAIGMPADAAVATAGLASQKPWIKESSNQLATASKLNPQKTWSEQQAASRFSASSIAALELHCQGAPGASVLREIANSYAVRWSSREDFSYSWLGPLILLLVAKMVFLLVLSLFLPLITLISSLSG